MRTHLVTGANSGIGLETVRALAAKGERVIMAVRDRQRGEAARSKVLAELPHARLDLELVDLLDLDSVRALAERVDALDVLINNAGLGTAPLSLTKERVYSQFGANHLGHFLLTALLLPKLERGADPRVVTVTSGFGRRGSSTSRTSTRAAATVRAARTCRANSRTHCSARSSIAGCARRSRR